MNPGSYIAPKFSKLYVSISFFQNSPHHHHHRRDELKHSRNKETFAKQTRKPLRGRSENKNNALIIYIITYEYSNYIHM
jgi:hypothetical protein